MLQLKKISITHKQDYREIVKDFSFSLRPGDKAVMIGEEGNGKSTQIGRASCRERVLTSV